MPICTECKKPIEERKELKFENLYFCNNLCRFTYSKRGSSNSISISSIEKPNTVKRKYKAISITLCIFGLIVASIFVVRILNQIHKANALKEAAVEINKSTPKYIDDETVLTAVTSDKNVLNYEFKLISANVQDIDKSRFNHVIERQYLPGMCTNPETRILLDDDVIIVLNFYDKFNANIKKYVIASELCRWRGYP